MIYQSNYTSPKTINHSLPVSQLGLSYLIDTHTHCTVQTSPSTIMLTPVYLQSASQQTNTPANIHSFTPLSYCLHTHDIRLKIAYFSGTSLMYDFNEGTSLPADWLDDVKSTRVQICFHSDTNKQTCHIQSSFYTDDWCYKSHDHAIVPTIYCALLYRSLSSFYVIICEAKLGINVKHITNTSHTQRVQRGNSQQLRQQNYLCNWCKLQAFVIRTTHSRH